MVVRIDLTNKEGLIGAKPGVFSTPLYDGYPAVLVELKAAKAQELRQLLSASWRFVAPPRPWPASTRARLSDETRPAGRDDSSGGMQTVRDACLTPSTMR